MSKKKCINCWEQVDVNAVICISCGTNQQNGQYLKTHNSPKKKKSFSKLLLVLLLFAGIITGSFHVYKWNKEKSRKAAMDAVMIPKDDTIAPPKPVNAKAVVAETLSFPRNISDAEDAGQYKVYTSSRVGFGRTKTASGKYITKGRINLSTRVLPPAGTKGQFRLKIYSGKSANGEYKLIYDRIATTKLQKPASRPSMKDRFLTLPDKYKNAPERVKKRILEMRKKSYERMKTRMPEKRPQSASFCARFLYSNNEFEIPPEQHSLYFRVLLCNTDGSIIKESPPKRYEVRRFKQSTPRQYDPSMKYGSDSRPPSLDGHTIYLYLSGSNRALKFAFMEKDAFKITSFSIDGIKYLPVFTGSVSKMTHTDRKTKTNKIYYSSSMSLKYPFGGQVKLKFKYKRASGKFKKATFLFYLPPPPPLISLKASSNGDTVNISWDKIDMGIDESHFIKVPKLVLQRNRKELKRLSVYQQNSCADKDIFRGEQINYKLSFKDGIFKAPLWSAEKGTQTYKLQCQEQTNPFSDKGIDILIPLLTKEKHPVRIELLKSSICYENTGIASCELLKTIIDGIKKEKDMVLYDRDSRNYIIDEKFFALSKTLKKQFQIKESDYALQIKDYSRQNGNGLELWLFKKKIGSGGNKQTVYWKVGDISISSNEKNMHQAAEQLIAKIRETLEFISSEDTREKNIQPANVICPTLRPVNQKYVMVNYEAVCESLFLTLGEKSDTIRILSKNDWEQIFNERISRFDEGHSFIDNTVREVLLTGRIWRKGKVKKYYVQACDAFSGEVLGSKILTGKIRDAAVELAAWIKEFRLSDDIKVDFPMSKFIRKHVRQNILNRPWRPREDLLENYGPSITKPQERRGRMQRYQATRKTTQKESFYVFVKRQWKDGFRAKAIKLLQDDWKKSKNIKTGTLLGTYYIESKRYQDAIDLFKKKWEKEKNLVKGYLLSSYYIAAKRYRDTLAVYDKMLLLDGCPKKIYDNYNLMKRRTAGEKPKLIAKKEMKRNFKVSTHYKGQLQSVLKTTDAMDYSTISTSYTSGKAVTTKRLRNETDNNEDLNKYYFIDRDKIYPEWAPNQPCRTATLIFSIPKKLLSQGINSKVVRKYGIWLKALRLATFGSYNVEFLFRKWRWLPLRPHIKNNRFYTGSSSRAAAEDRQMRSVCKPKIIVFEVAWNSIDPFDKRLNNYLAYTRLGYFFDIHNHRSNLLDNLYHRSKIRAFFELKKNPKISFPRFTFTVSSVRKAFVSRIRTGKDMIRYLALELAEKDRFSKMRKSKINVRYLKLYQMLALDYIVRHESNTTLQRIYRMIKSEPVPTTLEEYRKSPVGAAFLVFMAYKKNKKAVKMLHVLLKNSGYISNKERADYTYVLAQAGYKKITMKMAPTRGVEVTTLRWLPAKILAEVSGWAPYFVFGTKNDTAARRWFLNYRKEKEINHYFGKLPAEAYRDWKIEHLKLVKELKNQAAKEKTSK
jgi:hypothetical protein